MANKHHAHVYHTLSDLLDRNLSPKADYENENQYLKARKYWVRIWNSHRARNGNIPLVLKCSICSGKEHKKEIKEGRWKVPKNLNELIQTIKNGIMDSYKE